MSEISKNDNKNVHLQDLSKEKLIALIENFQTEKTKRKAANQSIAAKIGKIIFGIFTGLGLYQASIEAWEQWSIWLKAPHQCPWPEKATGQFVAALISRMMRISLVALLVAIAFPLIQTLIFIHQNNLVEQQNEQFDRQNTFIVFEQTTKFQKLLFQFPVDSLGNELTNYHAHPERIYRWPAPNQSVTSQIVKLAENERDVVVNALRPLLHDKATSIASGAFLSLYSIKASFHTVRVQLQQADLQNTYLPKVYLGGANLKEANLGGAYLNEAYFFRANLEGVNFSLADLEGADFSETIGLTIDQLCKADNLQNIKPDSLLAEVQIHCPQKL